MVDISAKKKEGVIWLGCYNYVIPSGYRIEESRLNNKESIEDIITDLKKDINDIHMQIKVVVAYIPKHKKELDNIMEDVDSYYEDLEDLYRGVVFLRHICELLEDGYKIIVE